MEFKSCADATCPEDRKMNCPKCGNELKYWYYLRAGANTKQGKPVVWCMYSCVNEDCKSLFRTEDVVSEIDLEVIMTPPEPFKYKKRDNLKFSIGGKKNEEKRS